LLGTLAPVHEPYDATLLPGWADHKHTDLSRGDIHEQGHPKSHVLLKVSFGVWYLLGFESDTSYSRRLTCSGEARAEVLSDAFRNVREPDCNLYTESFLIGLGLSSDAYSVID
jgi:hypothetical protein